MAIKYFLPYRLMIRNERHLNYEELIRWKVIYIY